MKPNKPSHLFETYGKPHKQYEPDPDFLIATTPHLEGRPVREHLGLVMGEAIIAPDVFRDFAASITSIFGGRSVEYETPLHEARNIAISEAVEECKRRGANAMLGVDLDYESLESGMLLVSVTGTAVRIE